MAARLLDEAGVPMVNLIDHWVLPETTEQSVALRACGFVETATWDGDAVWEHPLARLPRIRLEQNLPQPRVALAVEDLAAFAEAHALPTVGQHGDPDSGYEEARYPLPAGTLAVVVRQGYRGFRPGELSANALRTLKRIRQQLRNRDRSGGISAALPRTQHLLESVVGEIGPERATDAFFAAEREFYMARNHAARQQYARQQQPGIGWANHDHHTYRSSRAGFRSLIHLWHTLGFVSRERYDAGAEAGWGAQILEHPVSKIVIFADVDVAPEELDLDFSQTDLPPRSTLGTIGLWCALHGDSIADAGMHHLECEFDFERARTLFEAGGIQVMTPFTDLPMLKQAFTVAERWRVDPERVAALHAHGMLTAERAEQFLTYGAPGSHLEILQRWEGFKGFNKTGVSAILRATDARQLFCSEET